MTTHRPDFPNRHSYFAAAYFLIIIAAIITLLLSGCGSAQAQNITYSDTVVFAKKTDVPPLENTYHFNTVTRIDKYGFSETCTYDSKCIEVERLADLISIIYNVRGITTILDTYEMSEYSDGFKINRIDEVFWYALFVTKDDGAAAFCIYFDRIELVCLRNSKYACIIYSNK